MKRLAMLFMLLLVASQCLSATTSLTSSEREELLQIVRELKSLNDEQQIIIENSQKRNSELESLLEEQKKSSEQKQRIIDEQEKSLEEAKNLRKEQKKSSLLTLINSIIIAVAAFFGGYFMGNFVFRS